MELLRAWGAIKNPQDPDDQAALGVLLAIGITTKLPQVISMENVNAFIREHLSF